MLDTSDLDFPPSRVACGLLMHSLVAVRLLPLKGKDAFGRTVLHCACVQGRVEAVEMVLRLMLADSADIEARDERGRTPSYSRRTPLP